MDFKLCFRRWCRWRSLLVVMLIIWFIQALWLGNRDGERRTKNRDSSPREFPELPESLVTEEIFINSFGKVLTIAHTLYNSTTNDDVIINVTLNTVDVDVPKFVRFGPNPPGKYANSKKYAYVIGRYWEQMSQSMLAFLSLVLQASDRRVVAPMVKNSRFDITGLPLGYYFDRKYIRDMLHSYGYNDIVDKEEFIQECSPDDPDFTTVHFLYEQAKAASFTKKSFELSDTEYEKMSLAAGKNGWTTCPFIQRLTKQNPKSKMFCVNTSLVTEWSILERDIIQSAKCLSIVVWRGIGSSFRSHFKETGFQLRSHNFFLSLKPNVVVNEAVEQFRHEYLGSKYLAVHIRGEHIAISHGIDRLKQCIHILGYMIRRIKTVLHSSYKVFVATDMSKYGSNSWASDVKLDNVTPEVLAELQDLVISATSGVTVGYFADTDERLDRGLVALMELSLVAQAEGLITIGYSSFHKWVTSKFLDFHRNDSPKDWSLVKICFTIN